LLTEALSADDGRGDRARRPSELNRDEIRGDVPELAKPLRIEEREPEAGATGLRKAQSIDVDGDGLVQLSIQ
jgi:hypothetical protein